MKRAFHGLALVALGASGVSCQMLNRVVHDPTVAELKSRVVRDTAAAVTDPQTRAALEQCDTLEHLQVDIGEERALGGAIALNWASTDRGLLADVPNPLPASWQEATVPATPRNELVSYVNLVGKNLAAQSGRPLLPWTFAVVDSDQVNAYSAPGGYVFVTTGLLRTLQSEDELAGLLAHEIGHVTERHALKTYGRLKTRGCKAEIYATAAKKVTGPYAAALKGSTAGFLDLDKQLDALVQLADGVVGEIRESGFSSNEELDADRLGLGLVLGAGYSPRPFMALLGRLPKGKAVFPHHPEGRERQQKLQAWLDQQRATASEEFQPNAYEFLETAKVPMGAQMKVLARQ